MIIQETKIQPIILGEFFFRNLEFYMAFNMFEISPNLNKVHKKCKIFNKSLLPIHFDI